MPDFKPPHPANWIGASRHAKPLRDEFKPSELNPAFNGNPDFDWESVFANCDGEAVEDDDVKRLASKMTARTIKTIGQWLLAVNMRDHRALKSIGVRTVAMLWVTNPELFDGASMTTIAKSLGYADGRAMNDETSEFSRRFGITNKFQAHDSHKKKS